MNASKQFTNSFAAGHGALKRILLTAATFAIASSAGAVRAAERPYNPDHLGPDQLARVSGICARVIGLSASEPLSSGYWLGNSRLDFDTNHYRGCIVSLSDSLQSALDVEISRQAVDNCHAKGLESGSADMALCVLEGRHPNRASEQPVSTVTVLAPARSSGSFFYASPHELNRREETACASLGLEPDQAGFGRCVKDLKDTFSSIDNPMS